MAATLYWSVVAVICAYIGHKLLHNLYLSPLSAYPGPFFSKIFHFPTDYLLLTGTFHLHLEKLHQQYGPVVRTRPNELSSIKGTTWSEVYGPRLPEMMHSDPHPRTNGVEGVSSATTEDHRRFRKMLSPSFSAQGMREQEPRIQKFVDLLIAGLEERAVKKEPVDMAAWFNWTTFVSCASITLLNMERWLRRSFTLYHRPEP